MRLKAIDPDATLGLDRLILERLRCGARGEQSMSMSIYDGWNCRDFGMGIVDGTVAIRDKYRHLATALNDFMRFLYAQLADLQTPFDSLAQHLEMESIQTYSGVSKQLRVRQVSWWTNNLPQRPDHIRCLQEKPLRPCLQLYDRWNYALRYIARRVEDDAWDAEYGRSGDEHYRHWFC